MEDKLQLYDYGYAEFNLRNKKGVDDTHKRNWFKVWVTVAEMDSKYVRLIGNDGNEFCPRKSDVKQFTKSELEYQEEEVITK